MWHLSLCIYLCPSLCSDSSDQAQLTAIIWEREAQDELASWARVFLKLAKISSWRCELELSSELQFNSVCVIAQWGLNKLDTYTKKENGVNSVFAEFLVFGQNVRHWILPSVLTPVASCVRTIPAQRRPVWILAHRGNFNFDFSVNFFVKYKMVDGSSSLLVKGVVGLSAMNC